ncbi:alpha/beta fold hydrolase [Sphingobacterium cellulitidis]|uniref:alpha/beta fold hydrolase n=1 Tax=Sphingobacterium cellulitidis TaxID=1768011 RepID=UPI001C52AD47|nr:alpha/beta hydrolase [Sphingobacterium cellulitidis]
MNLKKIIMAIIVMVFTVTASHSQSTEYSFKVEKSGTGNQNIIFIPGFASSGDVWNDTRDVLAKNNTCYILTMSGFAGVPAKGDPTFKGWRDEVIKYIKNENIQAPIIIGHSMGGVMAMDIAATEPTLIKKIIVVDALPCLAALSNPNFKSNPNLDCSEMVKQFSTVPDAQFEAMQKQGMAGMTSDTVKQKLILDWSLKSDRKIFAKMFCDFSNTDLREDIKNIQCPALILLESSFNQIKPAIENQYSNLKTAKLIYADNSLHFIMFDAKDWYLQEVQNFIK